MDEVNVAIEFELIKLESVVDIINKKPEHVELILTGRYAHKTLIEMADLVTEMVNVKHPFEKGITARKGVDF
jgi:cob(I)alamin adenosyltransferase